MVCASGPSTSPRRMTTVRVTSSCVGCSFAAHYSVELSRRTSQGWRKRSEKGLPPGDIPFGYRSEGSQEPPSVVSEEADAIRDAFARYTRGDVSLMGVADRLNRLGHKPRSKVGHPAFGQKTVRGMLSNRFYPGDISYHGDVVARGQHDPIIDRELFDASKPSCGDVLGARRPTHGGLSGPIFWGESRLRPLRRSDVGERHEEREARLLAVCGAAQG